MIYLINFLTGRFSKLFMGAVFLLALLGLYSLGVKNGKSQCANQSIIDNQEAALRAFRAVDGLNLDSDGGLLKDDGFKRGNGM
jgi:hypothetical protein